MRSFRMSDNRMAEITRLLHKWADACLFIVSAVKHLNTSSKQSKHHIFLREFGIAGARTRSRDRPDAVQSDGPVTPVRPAAILAMIIDLHGAPFRGMAAETIFQIILGQRHVSAISRIW